MSHTIWVDVCGRSKDDVPQDNSIIHRMKDQLDRLSEKLNVAKLSGFYDYSELIAQYGDLDDDEEESAESGGSWFDPEQALAAVRAIHGHLLKHPEDLGFKSEPSCAHWPERLMDELKHCQTVLEGAVSRGIQFRLLIVP